MNILTFDIEEWALAKAGGYGSPEKNAEYDTILNCILNMLDIRGLKATFFCTGLMAKDFPEVVKLIQGRGHEIGCHSNVHTWMNKLTIKEAAEDTHLAIDALEQCIGSKVTCYRAPAFSIGESNKWMFEVLANEGILSDSSVFPALHAIGGFPDFQSRRPCTIEFSGIKLKEYPISLTSVFGRKLTYSGGGYFRFFPLGFIKKQIVNNDYTICYFHIEDVLKEKWRILTKEEYEAYYKEPGTLKNRYIRYVKTNFGKKQAFGKMMDLIASTVFVSLGQAEKMIDWEHAPSVIL